MTSPARRSPNASERCTSVAVVSSSVPRRARRCELLLRLDPQPAQDRVRGAVEERDHRPQHRGERVHEPGHGAGGRERPGDREVLRDELAEEHRERRGEDEGQRHRHAADRALRHAERLERRVDEVGDRRLGEVADDEVRDRDPDLRGRQLRGERPERRGDGLRPAVALLGRALDGCPVDRHERELGGDEGATGRDERQGDQDEQHFGQCVERRARP
jgi:hypothetical protein